MSIIKRERWYCYAVLGIMLACGTSWAGQLMDRDFAPQQYPGSDHRDFYVYVPDSYDGQREIPMVMVLHGCHQSRDTVFNEFGWDELSDQEGFLVVAPDISTNDLMRNPKCWGYWESKEIHQGRGEVEDLHRIGLQVEQEWRIDPDRRHIAGLSSGGFMANAAAVAHNEYWASAGVHSGGGYNESVGTYSLFCANPRESSGHFKSPTTIAADMRSERDSGYAIPVMLIHSTNDCSVGYGVEGDPSQWGGLTSNRDAWLAVNGGALYDTADCSRDAIACSHLKFGADNRSTVEVVRIQGLIQGTDAEKGHYWSGGERDGQWTRTRGPMATPLLWDFFQRHPRPGCDGCPAAPTGLRAVRIGHQEVTLAWNPSNETGAAGYRLYRDGHALQSVPITGTTYTDTALQPGGTFTYVLKTVNEAGIESPGSEPLTVRTHTAPGCRSYAGPIAEHVAEGRAYAQEQCRNWWCWIWPWPKTLGYYARGSDEFLGEDDNLGLTLYTLDGDRFSTTDCSAVE